MRQNAARPESRISATAYAGVRNGSRTAVAGVRDGSRTAVAGVRDGSRTAVAGHTVRRCGRPAVMSPATVMIALTARTHPGVRLTERPPPRYIHNGSAARRLGTRGMWHIDRSPCRDHSPRSRAHALYASTLTPTSDPGQRRARDVPPMRGGDASRPRISPGPTRVLGPTGVLADPSPGPTRVLGRPESRPVPPGIAEDDRNGGYSGAPNRTISAIIRRDGVSGGRCLTPRLARRNNEGVASRALPCPHARGWFPTTCGLGAEAAEFTARVDRRNRRR